MTITIKEEWLPWFQDIVNHVCNFTADIQSDELFIGTKPYAGAEVHEQAQALITFKNCISPETLDCVSGIKEQLDNPIKADKYAKMREAWDNYCHKIVGDSKIPDSLESALSTFDCSVGCTVEEVCYAGYAVIREADSKIRKVSPDLYEKIQEWILTCVSYYEDNWRAD